VQIARNEGRDVAHIQVRYLSPFPRNLGDLLKRYERVLVPEMNNGQLVKLLRAEYLVDAQSFPKVTGKPFRVTDIAQAIRKIS
jgi:2-oxoglutarate ferredoxin oxidoreductase subunit alpha